MNFWQRMKDSLTRWMYGRYGADQLSRVILYASLFLLFVSFFTGLLLPFYLSIAGYGWMIFQQDSAPSGKEPLQEPQAIQIL